MTRKKHRIDAGRKTEWRGLTDEEKAQSVIVEHDLIELMNRLLKEGFSARTILHGINAAIKDFIVSVFGLPNVLPWYVAQCHIVRAQVYGDDDDAA